MIQASFEDSEKSKGTNISIIPFKFMSRLYVFRVRGSRNVRRLKCAPNWARRLGNQGNAGIAGMDHTIRTWGCTSVFQVSKRSYAR